MDGSAAQPPPAHSPAGIPARTAALTQTQAADSGGLSTLAVDCGGTGTKACVLDATGAMASERVRTLTPYPCPPSVLVGTIASLAAQLPPYDRVSVGVPGLVRGGVVLATPHYVTEAGPFTPVRPDLLAQWAGYDIRAALEAVLGRPTRVVNDAEVQALAVVLGSGYEVMLTLGTGLGFAQVLDGRLLPKVELSQHPLAKGETYDQRLGHHTRVAIGDSKWNRRVLMAVDTLRPVLWWDRLFVGGGGAKHLTADTVAALGLDVRIVPNTAGLLGGVRLWDRRPPARAAAAAGQSGRVPGGQRRRTTLPDTASSGTVP